ELALELIQSLGFLVPRLQLGDIAFLQSPYTLLDLLPLGDIPNDGRDVDSVVCSYRAQAYLDGKLRSVFTSGKQVKSRPHRSTLACRTKGLAEVRMPSAISFWYKDIHSFAQQLFWAISKHCLGSAIRDNNGSRRVNLK